MTLLTLLFPLAFWITKWLGLPFWWAGLGLIPLFFFNKKTELGRLLGPIALIVGTLALIGQIEQLLYFYPLFVNVAFLLLFGSSLLKGPPIIERIARSTGHVIPDNQTPYFKKCTIAWCLFFIFNGSIAVGTALLTDKTYWALYNGAIAYLLMGLMFMGEWIIRQRKIKHAR